MNNFQHLQNETDSNKNDFNSIPIILSAAQGQVGIEHYIAFLCEAYHHVKHTVPLLMGCGMRLPERLEWLRTAMAEYIEEEMGHQEWILNDIKSCGVNSESVRRSKPSTETEIMVAYAYDTIQRGNPVGFLGMVYVLEGTSVALADKAAKNLQQNLGLPATAFTYLTTHGGLDQEHIVFFESLVNRLDLDADRKAVIHCAKVFYLLYGNIFRAIENQFSHKAA